MALGGGILYTNIGINTLHTYYTYIIINNIFLYDTGIINGHSPSLMAKVGKDCSNIFFGGTLEDFLH